MEDWKKAILKEYATINEAIKNLNEVCIQIILVVDDGGHLIGTLSDGDIRRALLKGLVLSSKIDSIINRNPLVVSKGFSNRHINQLMELNKVRQIPIIDENNMPIGLHLWNDSFNTNKRKNTFVIMAGGQGKRLRPYTENCPKPMIEIEGKPMLEHILYRAKLEGFQNFIISINYLGQIIKDYFGDGSRHNINIKYVNEDLPLGTAGSLSLLELPDEPFLVSNGDIISDISYGNLLDFHIKHNAVATMAIKIHQWQNPFGIVSMDGIVIKGFEEKPIIKSQVNAGVYALSKDSLDSLIKNEKCDMPDLFLKLKSQKKLTIGYPIHEHWKDIGRPDDLKSYKLNS